MKHFAEAIRNRNVGLGLLTNFMYLWAEMGVATFLTLHLTSKVGLPLAEAAVISGASGITGWIGQIVWGAISDRLGRHAGRRLLYSAFWLELGFYHARRCLFIDLYPYVLDARDGWRKGSSVTIAPSELREMSRCESRVGSCD